DLLSQQDHRMHVHRHAHEVTLEQSSIVLAEKGHLAAGKGDLIDEVLPADEIVVAHPAVHRPGHLHGEADTGVAIRNPFFECPFDEPTHGPEVEGTWLPVFPARPELQVPLA